MLAGDDKLAQAGSVFLSHVSQQQPLFRRQFPQLGFAVAQDRGGATGFDAAVDDFDPQHLFENFDAARKGGLCYIAQAGCIRHAAAVEEGHQVFDPVYAHLGPLYASCA